MSSSVMISGSAIRSSLPFSAHTSRITSMISGFRSDVTRIPLRGHVDSSERAISGSVSPITSWWSSRTLVSTPMFERTIMRSLTSWYSGLSAMHSMISASTPGLTYCRQISICSRIVAGPLRWIGSSTPTWLITAANVPVDLATVTSPASRIMPAMIRVTVDLPRMPFTWTRHWSASMRRRCATYSARQRARRATQTATPARTMMGTTGSSASLDDHLSKKATSLSRRAGVSGLLVSCRERSGAGWLGCTEVPNESPGPARVVAQEVRP